MKKELAEKMRELIRAEILSHSESVSEDEDGYRGCSNREEKNAEKIFQEFLEQCIKGEKLD